MISFKEGLLVAVFSITLYSYNNHYTSERNRFTFRRLNL